MHGLIFGALTELDFARLRPGTVPCQGLIKDAHSRQMARRIAEAVPDVRSAWGTRASRREWQGRV